MAELKPLFMFDEAVGNPMFVHQVRRDPELGHHQVYLVNDKTKHGKGSLEFIQALGDATKDEIIAYVFLGLCMDKPTPSPPLMRGCAIDERERLLYILLGGGDLEIRIYLFHLCYEAADKFGYCRISAEEGGGLDVECETFCRQKSPLMLTPATVHSLAVCPVTGKLVAGFSTLDYSDHRMAFFPIVLNQDLQEAQPNVVADGLSFMTPLTSQMQLQSCVFSRSNHLLFWLRSADGGCIVLKSFTPGLGDPRNSHLNQLEIDPVKLAKSLLSTSVFDNLVARLPNIIMPKYLGLCLELLGHVHKYIVFIFQSNKLLAAKWPKEWYKLTQLPSTPATKVLMFVEEELGEMNSVCLYGTDLYLKFNPPGGAPIHQIRKLSLGQYFKDYRHCAFCGKQESKKKHNKEGKRVSSFKVCRKCKELNFHLFHSDANLACHYCSDECQQKHWKKHKIIHKKEAKDSRIVLEFL